GPSPPSAATSPLPHRAWPSCSPPLRPCVERRWSPYSLGLSSQTHRNQAPLRPRPDELNRSDSSLHLETFRTVPRRSPNLSRKVRQRKYRSVHPEWFWSSRDPTGNDRCVLQVGRELAERSQLDLRMKQRVVPSSERSR